MQTATVKMGGWQPIGSHIFVDRCSIEVFANQGERVISNLVFPSPSRRGMELYSKGGGAKIVRLDVWNLKSVWHDQGM